MAGDPFESGWRAHGFVQVAFVNAYREPNPGCRWCGGTGMVCVQKDPDVLDDCACTEVRVLFRILWGPGAGLRAGRVVDRTPVFASHTAAEAIRRGMFSGDLMEVVEVAA